MISRRMLTIRPRVLTLLLLLPAAVGASAASERHEPVTAILGAFDAEVELIKQTMTARYDTAFLDINFTVGMLKGRRVVLAAAGVGKVNSAVTTALLIEHFSPEEILLTGIAGGIGPDLRPGDIVIGVKTAQHDYGLLTGEGLENRGTKNPATGVRNPVFLPADDRLLELAKEASTRVDLKRVPADGWDRNPRILEGIIVSGDAFIASDAKKKELRDRFNAAAVEMEGAAVAQICYQTGIPCLVIRSISDLADASARTDVELFHRIAAYNSASFVMNMVELLAGAETQIEGNRKAGTK